MKETNFKYLWYRNTFKQKQGIKILLKYALLVVSFFFMPHIVNAKYKGAYIPKNNLYYVSGKYFNVVFKGDMYIEALKILNNVDHFYPYITKGFTIKKGGNRNIFLDTRQSIINASVETYPKRMAIYYFYPQFRSMNGNIDWLDMVCLHESRHILQNSYFYHRGPNQMVTAFIGVRFPAFEAPNWFSEGDAVYTESIFSNAGRGRSPCFAMKFKASVLENKSYNYTKAVNESKSKNIIRNAYDLGYHLICYLRKTYGDDIVARIIKKLGKIPYLVYPFDLVVYSETKRFMSDIYQDMVKDLKLLWVKQIKDLKRTSATIISNNKDSFSDYKNYFNPQILDSGDIIVVKKEFSSVSSFVAIKNGKEIKLIDVPYIGIGGDIDRNSLFSAHGDKIVWVEFQYSPVLLASQDSLCKNIKLYDVSKKKIRQLTKKAVYDAPCLSHDTKKVVAVRTNRGKQCLEIIDVSTKKIVKKIKNENNNLLLDPSWSLDDKYVFFIKARKQENALVKYNVKTDEEEVLIPYTTDIIQKPIEAITDGFITQTSSMKKNEKVDFKNNFNSTKYILFNSFYNGLDCIYAFEPVSKKIYRVACGKYGVFNSIVYRGDMIFNAYQCQGMTVAKIKFDPNKWVPLEKIEDRRAYYFNFKGNMKKPLNHFKPSTQRALLKTPLDNIPKKRYKKRRWGTLRSLFDLQSIPVWPFDLESHGTPTDPAFTLKFKAKNITADSMVEGSISRMYLENKYKFELDYIYTRSIPNLHVKFEIDDDEDNYQDRGKMNVSPDISFPFTTNLDYGFVNKVNFKSIVNFLFNYKTSDMILKSYMPFLISWKVYKEKAKKDVAYPWGIHLSTCLVYSLTPWYLTSKKFGEDVTDIEIRGMMHLFFPGLFKNHSFQTIFAGKYRQSAFKDFYPDSIAKHSNDYPFWYLGKLSYDRKEASSHDSYFTRLSRKLLDIHLIYEMPLLYPDLNILNLLFIPEVVLKITSSFYIDFVNERPKSFHIPYFDNAGLWVILPNAKILRLPNKLKVTFGLGIGIKKDFLQNPSLRNMQLEYVFKTDMFDKF